MVIIVVMATGPEISENAETFTLSTVQLYFDQTHITYIKLFNILFCVETSVSFVDNECCTIITCTYTVLHYFHNYLISTKYTVHKDTYACTAMVGRA